MKYFVFLILCLAGIGWNRSADAAGNILYVDNAAGCPGTGSSSSPYCSIQNAFDHVNAGDTIRIRSGTGIYDQNAALNRRSGTVSSPIVIEADTGANFIIRSSNAGAADAAIRLFQSSYVTIQNLTFNGDGVHTSQYAVQVQTTWGGDLAGSQPVYGVQILNSTFRNWGGTAAQASTPSPRAAVLIGTCPTWDGCAWGPVGTIVRGNTFANNRQTDLAISHADGTLVENNTFTGVKCGKDVDPVTNTMGIKVGGGFDNGIIRNNVFHDFEPHAACSVPTNTGEYGGTIMAIWCDVGGENDEISNNLIYNIDPGDADSNGHASGGILIEAGCFNWTVKNNVLHDIGWTALAIRNYGSFDPSAWIYSPNYFINNTIYNVGGRVIALGAGKAVVKDNIVYASPNEALISPSFNYSGIHAIDYNLYFNPTGDNHIGQWGAGFGGQGADFATWKSQCNCDQHSMLADPLFVDIGASDFHLQTSSPARGAGEGGIDMGAYSSQGNSRPSAPTSLRVV